MIAREKKKEIVSKRERERDERMDSERKRKTEIVGKREKQRDRHRL